MSDSGQSEGVPGADAGGAGAGGGGVGGGGVAGGELVHHVELWMDDLATAERQWGPVLTALGCEPFQNWEQGRSWRRGGSYVVIEQSPALRAGGHDRLRAGINHLAVRGDRAAVLAVAAAAGWSVRTDTGQAVHLTDSQGFELEVVYG